MLRALVTFLALAAASPAPAPAPVDSIDGAALKAHIAALADDAMEGRGSGTRGGRRAVDYIAAELHKAGLAPGAADGGWWQRVDLIERRPLFATMRWQAKGGAGEVSPEDFIALASDPQVRIGRVPVVYAGYGLSMAGAQARGAVVLMMPGKPPGSATAPPFDLRRAAFARQGALAVIALAPSDADWLATRARNLAGRTILADERSARIEGVLAARAWAEMASAMGIDAAQLTQDAASPDFRARRLPLSVGIEARTNIRRYAERNVIGRIRGSDRPHEAVFVTAHWDHLGICRPPGAPDRICNGAVDNASGVAQMIEIARAMAAGPTPGRSAYFVATAAEELGLLGARALLRSPPVPLRRIKAVLNLDMTALAPSGEPIAVVGRGLTPLDPVVDATARSLGRSVDQTDAFNIYVPRQDGWEFLKRGVPAIMAGSSFTDRKRLDSFFAGNYHKPGDEAGEVVLDGAIEDGTFHIALVRALADPARFPKAAP
jgi:hypothetical protein